MAAPASRRDLRFGIDQFARFEQPAGDRQRAVRRVGLAQFVDRETDEFVDVADIVGEQDEMLEMLGRGAGVMLEPRQAEVGARGVEQRQRAGRVDREVPAAVGDLVADVDQLGRGEPARQFGRGDPAELQILAGVEHVGEGDFARRMADRDAHRIIADEMVELGGEIVAEQGRAGDAGGVDAGLVQPREGAGWRRRRRVGVIFETQFGISEAAFVARLAVGAGARRGIIIERGAEVGDRRIVDGAKFVEDAGNLV